MKLKITFFISILVLIGLFSLSLAAQDVRITSFEVKERNPGSEYLGGKLYITVNGQQKMIAESAQDVWLINNGKDVVYSGRDGSGGYEGEGQSLRIYNAKTGKTKKIMSHYEMIMGVTDYKLSNGKTVILVRAEDGGLGASSLSIVDPDRGEIFYEGSVEVVEAKNDKIKLNHYKEEDWENLHNERGADFYDNKEVFTLVKSKVKPSKTQILDLNRILKNKVIARKNTMELLDAGFKNVKIYLWRVNDEKPNKNFVLGTVERQVEAVAPLRPALEELFRGATKDEEEKGFGTSTFGMKFEGVVLKNGVATVKFSQPKNETNYGTLGPFIFLDAIEKTAKQFPTVKKVEVCAIGETLIDGQIDKQFPRCK